MGVMKKGKRKIIVDNKVFWWFVEDDSWSEPTAQIIADDHSLIANCNLYCPVLRITKDKVKGRRSVPVPENVGEMVFTPQFISQLIRLTLE